MTACNAQLITAKPRAPRSPESPGVREANASRSISTGDSTDYPPSRFEDFKRNEILSISAFERPREAPRPDAPRTTQRQDEPRRQTYNYRQAAGLASGKIVISKPFLQANGEQNPLNKIPTMSLEDAVKTERERRTYGLRRESDLIAHRPAPQPPTLTPEEGLMRAVSLKRKTVASVTSEQMFGVPALPTGLTPAAVTTSAELLSPGVEEVRRRSPRQSPTTVQTIQNIRPSRQLPEPNQSVSDAESAKTPLQRRPTIGLPGNPRAKAIKPPAKDAENQRQQTVLFINKIEYDDPEAVESLIQGATSKAYDARASMSVVHRPRPIPRNLDEDRNIFPAEAAPNLVGHCRSKSLGSLGARKSLLRLTSANPPQLPPMPLLSQNLPTYKGGQDTNRPLPNNTKSMTFDEKMTLLFPPPPSADGLPRRRSSVPDLPQISCEFMSITMSPMGESSRMSGRTSVRTESMLEVVELPSMYGPLAQERRRRLSDEAGDSWLPGVDTGNIMLAMQRALEKSSSSSRRQTNLTNERRASSPVLPQIRDSTWTAVTDVQSHDDFTTNWGSLHSSAVVVPIQANQRNARSTYVGGGRRDAADRMPQVPSIPGDSPPLTDEEEDRDGEMVEVKLEERSQLQWHRRIGDDCPTFSGRKERAWSRKMVPPTPLMLGVPSTMSPIIVKAAEPSPLESPEHALAQIQAQLRKFEDARMSVNESPSQRFALLEDLEKEMDMQAGHWRTMQQDLGRDSISSMRSLSTAAESRRQSMVSNGAMATTPGKGISAERRASRCLRMQSAHLSMPPPITEEKSSPTAAAAEMSGANAWQRKLFEAQAEFAGSASRLGGGLRHSKNFLDMSELGSPTPPDSDDSDFEIERYQPASFDTTIAAVAEAARKTDAARQHLWTLVAAQASTPMAAMLWTPAPRTLDESAALMEQTPHSSSRRRMIGKNTDADLPLIESSALWSEESAAKGTKQAGASLWVSKSSVATPAAPASPEPEAEGFEPQLTLLSMQPESEQKPARPVTQRPPRRRRATMLPDIVENPEPLPNKRDTLGIFQFPWGERSDMATFPPRTLMAMPGTMSSGGGPAISAALEARARELEEEEYSTSFFDDYDEEDELDKEVQGLDEDSDYSDSDDGFDENTLWEIASLLKSQQVPSKFSLLPPPLPPLEKDGSMGDMSERPSYEEAEIFVGMDMADMADMAEDVQGSSLWRYSDAVRATEAKKHMGVSQPDEATWRSYDSVSESATARSKARLSEPVTIATKQLWEVPAATAVSVMQVPSLWTAAPRTMPISAAKLWTPRQNKGMMTAGKAMLFDLEAAKAAMQSMRNRISDKEPAALSVPRAARTADYAAALETLTSNSLWASPKTRRVALLWVPMPKPAVKVAKSLLFDLDAATSQKLQSSVIRSTDKEPAALNAPRMARTPRYDSLEKLATSSLWTARSGRVAMLWALVSKPTVKASKSLLFDLDVATAQKLQAAVRTTDKEPAALHMLRKPRAVIQAPLEQLVSDCLWQSPRRNRINKALWAPKPRVTVQAKGLLFDREAALAEKQSAHTRTTDEEPAAMHMPRKVRKLSHAPLATLTSVRLWKSEARVVKALWAPKPVATIVSRGHLFDLAVAMAEKSRAHTRTTDQEPAGLFMTRKARKASRASLEKLMSTQLWRSSVVTKSLWAPKLAIAVKAPGHLFDLAAALAEKSRAHTRTSNEEPAALHMPRRARKVTWAPLETLTSSRLWKSSAVTKALWTPKSTVVVKAQGYLFDLAAALAEKSRAATRTTDKEPAALTMSRKARKASYAPLETLVSTSLWQSSRTMVAKKGLWAPTPAVVVEAQGRLFDLAAAIAEKSRAYTRTTDQEPAALHMARKARKASQAPLETLESVSMWQSSRTSAAGKTLWVPKQAVEVKTKKQLFDLEAAKAEKQGADTRTTAMEPVAARVVRMPRSPAQLPVLALSSTRLWSVEAAAGPSKAANNWILAKGRSFRKTALVAASEDWETALRAAVAASDPTRRRISATADEWQTALLAAVAQSCRFDAARKHPALAGSAVDGSAVLEHDAAKVHPVFFTGRKEEPESWAADYDDEIMAQIEALEHEREFAAMAVQQMSVGVEAEVPAEAEVQAAEAGMSEEDVRYYAYIQAMENEAMMRLQALEGHGVGVQLR